MKPNDTQKPKHVPVTTAIKAGAVYNPKSPPIDPRTLPSGA